MHAAQAFADDAESEAPDPILSPYLTGLSALTALCLESNSALGASFDALGLSLTHLSSLSVLRFRDNHECSEAQASTLFSKLAEITWLKVLALIFRLFWVCKIQFLVQTSEF